MSKNVMQYLTIGITSTDKCINILDPYSSICSCLARRCVSFIQPCKYISQTMSGAF